MIRVKTFRWIGSLALAVAALLEGNSTAAEEPKDIFYFGNSFTNATCCGSSQSVPDVISDIAVAAGHPAPRNVNGAANGKRLQWHLEGRTRFLASRIPEGESWEHVVLQNFSTWPTHIGNLTEHLSSSLGLYQATAAHSPDVEAILFETWARGPGHAIYVGDDLSFPGGPAQMQQEVRNGYRQSTQNINTVAGSEVAKYAPVGDAWENADFSRDLYSHDIYHASNQGTLLNALVLYGTMYDDTNTSAIDLSGVLAGLQLSAADGQFLTSVADATLVPEPAALMLVGVGVFALAVRRRKMAQR